MNQTNAIRNGFHSIEQVTDTYLKKGIRESGKSAEISFARKREELGRKEV